MTHLKSLVPCQVVRTFIKTVTQVHCIAYKEELILMMMMASEVMQLENVIIANSSN